LAAAAAASVWLAATCCRTPASPPAGGVVRTYHQAMTQRAARDARLASSLAWLITARWAGLLAQSGAIAAGFILLGSGPEPFLAFFLVALGAVSNLGAIWWSRSHESQPASLMGALIALDSLLLTAILALSGGAMNPLSIMYLVYITLAAVMLSPRATWITMAGCTVCFGGLFLLPWEGDLVATSDMQQHMEAMRQHVQSMWWSFVLAAVLTAYFGSRLSARLDLQSAALAAARDASERSQRLASLTTLAAGAAHELSTPLATIAVAAEELERGLRTEGVPAARLEDLRLINAEVARCRATLNQMLADAGQTTGELATSSTASDVARAALALLAPADTSRVVLDGELDLQVVAPTGALSQALANLLRNGLEADPSREPVHLTVKRGLRGPAFVVRDRGAGMSAEVLERAGEPFFTTKPTGRGMGLGVYLTRALVEQLGGHVRFDSRPGEGTTAVLELPARGNVV
jgi:two-component system sensor histidine kinase RegB